MCLELHTTSLGSSGSGMVPKSQAIYRVFVLCLYPAYLRRIIQDYFPMSVRIIIFDILSYAIIIYTPVLA